MVPTVPLGKEIPPEACGKLLMCEVCTRHVCLEVGFNYNSVSLVLVCPLFNPHLQSEKGELHKHSLLHIFIFKNIIIY